MTVWIVNGGPLFYDDSAAYLVTGSHMFASLGLTGMSDPAVVSGAGLPGAPATAPEDSLVIGSRAAVYALLIAGSATLGSLSIVTVFNAAAIFCTVWISVRALLRGEGGAGDVAEVTAIALIAGSLASLGFYVAYLMPDIFAPVLILSTATFAAFGQKLRGWERVVLLLLAVLAVVVHISHLLVAVLLLPIAALLAPGQRRQRKWIVLGLAALVLSLGLLERFAFDYAARQMQNKTVIYVPFLTARLIDDGPGRAYLRESCPDTSLATCALFDRIEALSDPKRFDAPVILFATDPARASYSTLPEATRLAIAQEQLLFARNAILSQPMASLAALLRNTGRQLWLSGVGMTIPDDALLAGAAQRLPPELSEGRLIMADRGWIGPLTLVHKALYLMSLLGVLWLIRRRGALPPDARVFAILILVGILANALICGGISVPADRYGARVSFLLPLLWVLLLSVRRRGPHQVGQENRQDGQVGT